MLQAHLTTPQDQLDSFASLERMFECIRPEKTSGLFEAGFIFTLPHHMSLINPKILPEDYYLVVIDNGRGPWLEIDEATRQVRINEMGQLPLAQQLLLSNKLQQYVVYSSHRPDLALLADKFKGTEFILDKAEEFSSEVLDFYYCESPRLTRLYLLCNKENI